MKKWFSLILISLGSAVTAQQPSDSAHFVVGIYGGYYIPDDATAMYYNGSDNNRLVRYMNDRFIKPDIEQALGNREFELAELAQDMAYQNSFSFELMAGITFGKGWQIAAHLHNVKLSSTGVFTLRVADPTNPTGTFNNLEQIDINGEETRSHIDIGLGKSLPLNTNFLLMAEGGLDMNFVEVTKNQFKVGNRVFNLPIYTDPLNQQASPGNTFGAGFYATLGAGYQQPAGLGIWFKLKYLQTNIDANRVVQANSSILIPSLGFTKVF